MRSRFMFINLKRLPGPPDNNGVAIEANLHNMSVRQPQLVFTSRKLVTALYKSPHCWSLRLGSTTLTNQRSVTELICSSGVPSIIIVHPGFQRAEPFGGARKGWGRRGRKNRASELRVLPSPSKFRHFQVPN